MADPGYFENDNQLVGLIQAANAAAEETAPEVSALGKRKRDDSDLLEDPEMSYISAPGEPDTPTVDNNGPQLQNSASVLFREPSAKSKKHSRPPLGKVFSSLELAPENFLKLQTAAKAYMLDETHPERRDVVGHKKNVAGSDLAKLNLFKCVEAFLDVHGYGEIYFGHNAGGQNIPDAPVRTLFWPEDDQAIIKLMMPLMRKMVTNERQRVYAANTRKLGPGKEKSEEPHSAIDPSMLDDSSRIEPQPVPMHESGMETMGHTHQGQQDSSTLGMTSTAPIIPAKAATVLHVNVITDVDSVSKRVMPRFSLNPEAIRSLMSLYAEVETRHALQTRNGALPVVRVWLPDGLITVADDREWAHSLSIAEQVEWMDGEIRVLVQV